MLWHKTVRQFFSILHRHRKETTISHELLQKKNTRRDHSLLRNQVYFCLPLAQHRKRVWSPCRFFVRKMQQRKRALLIMCCKFQQREDLSRQPGTTKAWLWGAPHNQKSYSSVKSSHLYSGIEMKNTLWDVQLSFLLRKSTAWNSKVPANDCLFSVGFLLVWQEGVYKWTEFGSAMQAGKLKSLTNSIGWGRDPMQDRCKHMGDFPFRGQRLNLKDTYAKRLRFRLGLHLLQQSTAR